MSKLTTYADPAEFCERHTGNSVVRRCCHMGNRYVAEMRFRGEEYGYIDYVEDLFDGNFICEAGNRLKRADLQAAWERTVARMQRGEPPTPEEMERRGLNLFAYLMHRFGWRRGC